MANYYVTVAGAGDNSGDSWANAMALSDFSTHISASASAGDIYYIKEGTYTYTGNITTALDGNDTAGRIFLIGVKSATTNEPPVVYDYSIYSDRPLFTGAYDFTVDNYWFIQGIKFATSTGTSLDVGNYCVLKDVWGKSTYNNVNASGLQTGTSCRVFRSYFESTYGRGIYCSGSDNIIKGCYLYACGVTGIQNISDTFLFDNIFDNCVNGATGGSRLIYKNNVLYNCTNGIDLTNVYFNSIVINNTFSNCTNGTIANASGVVTFGMFFDYNNWYNNTRDMSWDNGSTEDNSAKGANALSVDPGFVDAANGDFTLYSTSGLIDGGLGIQLGVG